MLFNHHLETEWFTMNYSNSYSCVVKCLFQFEFRFAWVSILQCSAVIVILYPLKVLATLCVIYSSYEPLFPYIVSLHIRSSSFHVFRLHPILTFLMTNLESCSDYHHHQFCFISWNTFLSHFWPIFP